MIALHLGGIPEIAMVLGPVLLIVAFLRIARRRDATVPEEDGWDPDLGDLPAVRTVPAEAVVLPERAVPVERAVQAGTVIRGEKRLRATGSG